MLNEVLEMAIEVTERHHMWEPTGLVIENEATIAEEVCVKCDVARLGEFANGLVPTQCHGSRERYDQWQRRKLERQNRCETLIRANSNWVWLDEAEQVRGLIPKKGFGRRVALLQAIATSQY